MTNMKHKSVEQRKHRHARYKAAINPIREAFGCTAVQAGPLVAKELRRNNDLAKELESVKQELEQTKDRLKVALAKVDELSMLL
jgi:hypothetical protein